MRHIIEQIPFQTRLMATSTCKIASAPRLEVAMNVNEGIDEQMDVHFVAGQHAWWKNIQSSGRRVRVTIRSMGAEVIKALADGSTPDQILYFYCPANAVGDSEKGGPDASFLALTDTRITLDQLNRNASTDTLLEANPLIFINACESAKMSASFYDGFVPYFMAKGARGVVGTECKVPDVFAMEWSKGFFRRFLDGETLGDAFLALRREFLKNHGNPLGLFYGVHCNGDTQIHPAPV